MVSAHPTNYLTLQESLVQLAQHRLAGRSSGTPPRYQLPHSMRVRCESLVQLRSVGPPCAPLQDVQQRHWCGVLQQQLVPGEGGHAGWHCRAEDTHGSGARHTHTWQKDLSAQMQVVYEATDSAIRAKAWGRQPQRQ